MSAIGGHLNHESLRTRLGRGLARLIGRLRIGVLRALAEETPSGADLAEKEGTEDLFDQLPEPVHLDHGDVKYADGKLRFLN